VRRAAERRKLFIFALKRDSERWTGIDDVDHFNNCANGSTGAPQEPVDAGGRARICRSIRAVIR
jgi:hypothetical protein